MKSVSAVLALFCCLILAACSNKSQSTVHEGHQGSQPPTLEVKWEVKGKTLVVDVLTDMHIAPEHYGMARMEGEGHIHMYLDDDGNKIGVKESHKVFPDLPTGHHTLKVSLHNNDHTPYDVTKTIEFDIP